MNITTKCTVIFFQIELQFYSKCHWVTYTFFWIYHGQLVDQFYIRFDHDRSRFHLLVDHLKLLVLQQVTMKLTRISLSVLSISLILPMNHLFSYMAATKSSDCTCISVSVSRLGSIWPGSGWLSCGISSSNSFLFEGLHPLIMQWLDHPSHPKRNLPELKQLRQKQERFLDFNWLLPIPTIWWICIVPRTGFKRLWS